MANQYRSEIPELTNLDEHSFENIFTMHKDDDFYFYNLLRTVNFPVDIDSNMYINYRVQGNQPLTTLSYRLYKTTKLWWLILIVNRIDNPLKFVEPGTQLKILKPEVVTEVIKAIKTQLI